MLCLHSFLCIMKLILLNFENIERNALFILGVSWRDIKAGLTNKVTYS